MLGRLLNGMAGAAGAALGSQVPAFLTQYRQQLSARLDQLREGLSELFSGAAQRGLSPAEFLERAAAEGGHYSQAVVADARRSLARLSELQAALDALVSARPMSRPFMFAGHFDPHVAEETARNFVPAVPLTIEGLVYAGLGLLLAIFLLSLLETGGRAARDRLRRRRPYWAKAK